MHWLRWWHALKRATLDKRSGSVKTRRCIRLAWGKSICASCRTRSFRSAHPLVIPGCFLDHTGCITQHVQRASLCVVALLRTSLHSVSRNTDTNRRRSVYSSGCCIMRAAYLVSSFMSSCTVFVSYITAFNLFDTWWYMRVCRNRFCSPCTTVSKVQSRTWRLKRSTFQWYHSWASPVRQVPM